MNTLIKNAYITRLFNKGVFVFSKVLLAPKNIDDEERQKEYALNWLLLGVIAVTLIFDGVIFWATKTHTDDSISFFVFSGVVLFFAALMVISRMGHYALSAYLLVAAFFAGNTYSAYKWSVELPVVLLDFALIIFIAALVAGRKFSFLVASFSAAVVILLGYDQSYGKLHPNLNWINQPLRLYDAIEYALLLLLILAVSLLSSRQIQKSLERAQASEAQLKLERDTLEIKVEERTREIKRLQVEKITQVSKITDFGRLAAGVFHDLINPLNAISLYLEQLRESETPEIKKELERVFSVASRLDSLVAAVRKQLQNQNEIGSFSLNSEIEHVLELLAFKARQQKVQIEFFQNDQVFIYGNSLKLFQVVSNLVSNAIDSFEGINDRKKTVLIRLSRNAGRIEISIEDNGCGISQEDLGKIFQPFFSKKRAENGIGIGLTNALEIIESEFKGEIKVQSVLSKGSVFIISIPQDG